MTAANLSKKMECGVGYYSENMTWIVILEGLNRSIKLLNKSV